VENVKTDLENYTALMIGWRRGSVVGTSVFGWRTLPNL